jgi:hypothetical protein
MLLGSPMAGSVEEGSREELRAARLLRARPREPDLPVDTEALRSDLRARKIAALTEAIDFTDAQRAVFWRILDDYEYDLAVLDRERRALIETNADRFGDLPGERTNDLTAKAVDLDSRRSALQQQYCARLETGLSPRTAARALRIERQIQFLIDLRVAASLPMPR